MNLSRIVSELGIDVVGERLRQDDQGRWSVLFDGRWLVILFERFSQLYFEIPVETPAKTLERSDLKLEGTTLRLTSRQGQKYVQGRVPSHKLTLGLLKASLEEGLELCERLSNIQIQTQSNSPLWTPTGVIRP